MALCQTCHVCYEVTQLVSLICITTDSFAHSPADLFMERENVHFSNNNNIRCCFAILMLPIRMGSPAILGGFEQNIKTQQNQIRNLHWVITHNSWRIQKMGVLIGTLPQSLLEIMCIDQKFCIIPFFFLSPYITRLLYLLRQGRQLAALLLIPYRKQGFKQLWHLRHEGLHRIQVGCSQATES